MKAVITGARGTVGSCLKDYLEKNNWEVIAWDRKKVPMDDYSAMQNFLEEEKPDVLFHLAIASQLTGHHNESWKTNCHWSSELAWITRTLEITLIFASTVMVFSNDAKGPFTKDSVPDAKEGYGKEKLVAEARVAAQNPQARIVRLGWQIGEKPGSNNMIDYFDKEMKEKGHISASSKWYPACSFLSDTITVLAETVNQAPGIYHIDSNEKWDFYEIAQALNELHNNPWVVKKTDHFVYDQRMKDDSLYIPSLAKRLNLS